MTAGKAKKVGQEKAEERFCSVYFVALQDVNEAEELFVEMC